MAHKKYVLLCDNTLFVFGNGQNMADINDWRHALCVWNEGLECFYFDSKGDDIEHVDNLLRRMLTGPVTLYTEEAVRTGGKSVRLELKQVVE